MIATCVGIKRDVVEADEFEGGLRAILNFGHTAAHAVENISGYKIPHGLAVAVGMGTAAEYAYKNGILSFDEAVRIWEIIDLYDLTTSEEAAAEWYELDPKLFTPESMAEVALSDKKAGGDTIKLVLPTKIGECEIVETPVNKLVEFMGGEK